MDVGIILPHGHVVGLETFQDMVTWSLKVGVASLEFLKGGIIYDFNGREHFKVGRGVFRNLNILESFEFLGHLLLVHVDLGQSFSFSFFSIREMEKFLFQLMS